MAILEVTNLMTEIRSVRGIIRPVDGVSLTVEKGQVVGIVGESGSGKSMTAFSLMRLFPTPTAKIISGEIKLSGNDLLRLSDAEMRKLRGKDISMIFQDPASYLNPVLSIGHQLRQQLAAHQMQAQADARIHQLLEQVGLSPEVAERFPHQLSGGQCQRVGIASSLACDPSLIIADEPTTALDVTIQAQILRLLKQLQKERDLSLIVITHDLGVVAEVCDYVYVMYAGCIVEEGGVKRIFETPQHPYTQGLLAGVLSLSEPKTIQVSIKGSVPDLAKPPSGCRFHPRCEFAMPICSKKQPQLFTVEASKSACWLHDEAVRT